MFIVRGREGSRSRGKGKWRGKEKREGERDETKKMGKERREHGIKKRKVLGKRRKIKTAVKTEGGEGLREKEGQCKAYNSQRVAVENRGDLDLFPSLHCKDRVEEPLYCSQWSELGVGVKGIIVRI